MEPGCGFKKGLQDVDQSEKRRDIHWLRCDIGLAKLPKKKPVFGSDEKFDKINYLLTSS
jgi:hypothetical protein